MHHARYLCVCHLLYNVDFHLIQLQVLLEREKIKYVWTEGDLTSKSSSCLLSSKLRPELPLCIGHFSPQPTSKWNIPTWIFKEIPPHFMTPTLSPPARGRVLACYFLINFNFKVDFLI
jgi:hypothetical protein